jgi:hypothetical protein
VFSTPPTRGRWPCPGSRPCASLPCHRSVRSRSRRDFASPESHGWGRCSARRSALRCSADRGPRRASPSVAADFVGPLSRHSGQQARRPAVPPLPRSWSVLQGFTNPASGSSVRRSGSDLRPLDRGPCRLHRVRFPDPERIRCAPLLNFDLSLGAPGLPPCHPRFRSEKGPSAFQAPLMRSVAPPALEVRSVHSFATLPQPLRSDLAVSHDLAGFLRFEPSRFLSGWHSWGLSALQGSPRSAGKLSVSGDLLPS